MHSDRTQNAPRRSIGAPLAVVAALTLGLGSGNAVAAPAKPKPVLADVPIVKRVDRPSTQLFQ